MSVIAVVDSPTRAEERDAVRELPRFLGIFPVVETGMVELGAMPSEPLTSDEARLYMLPDTYKVLVGAPA